MGVLQELLLKPTVRIRDPTQLQAKLDTIIQGGFDRLLVISDFDYTLSRYKSKDGERCWTTHGVFESATEQFSPELKAKFDELKTKYIPIEYCPNMTVAEKTPYMEQWWTESHAFIVQQKFTRSQIEGFVTRSKLALRDGAEQLLETVERHRVPLVLFSAGIGNIIEIFLRRQLSTIPPSLHIVSNMMEFDEDDICTSFSEPLIHTFCKNASVIDHDLPFFKSLRERTNVILLGDSFGDLQMDVGVEREGVALKIGFLNFNVDQLLDKYMHGFD
ncbi:Protein F25B5.3 c, partial [Aphelenchoides avenae]